MNHELRVEGGRERGARAHCGYPLRARVQHQAFQPTHLLENPMRHAQRLKQ